MRHLTLDDLAAALPDFLDGRGLVLESNLAFQLFSPGLIEVRRELDHLRSSSTGSIVLGEKLAQADAIHDGFAGALHLFAKAFQRLPDLPELDRDAITRLLRDILPEPADEGATYEAEVAKAAERENALTEEHGKELARFVIAPGRTLHDVYNAYLAAGKEIENLLRQRAEANRRRPFGRHAAGILRNRALSLMGQLRDALATELRHRPERLELLDSTSFAYIDLLERHRQLHGPTGAPLEPPP